MYVTRATNEAAMEIGTALDRTRREGAFSPGGITCLHRQLELSRRCEVFDEGPDVRQFKVAGRRRQVELENTERRVGNTGGGSDPRVVGAYRLQGGEFENPLELLDPIGVGCRMVLLDRGLTQVESSVFTPDSLGLLQIDRCHTFRCERPGNRCPGAIIDDD